YHKKLGGALAGDLPRAVEQARKFADGEYAQALRKGNRLPEDERKEVAKKMAALTGLAEEYVLKADLRVDAARFRAELLRDRGEVIGRYDSRIVGQGRKGKGGGKGGGGDPSYTAILGPF